MSLLDFKGPDLFSVVDCGQMMDSQGSALSDQRENEGTIHSLLNSSMGESGNVPNSLTTSQNMEKLDDLLVSLQEQSNSLSRSY